MKKLLLAVLGLLLLMESNAHIVQLGGRDTPSPDTYRFGHGLFRLTEETRYLLEHTSLTVLDKHLIRLGLLVTVQDLLTFTDLDRDGDWRLSPAEYERAGLALERLLGDELGLYHRLEPCELTRQEVSQAAEGKVGQVLEVLRTYRCGRTAGLRYRNGLVFRFTHPTLLRTRIEYRGRSFHLVFEPGEEVLPISLEQPGWRDELEVVVNDGFLALPLAVWLALAALALGLVTRLSQVLFLLLVPATLPLGAMLPPSLSFPLLFLALLAVGGTVGYGRRCSLRVRYLVVGLGASLGGLGTGAAIAALPLLTLERPAGIAAMALLSACVVTGAGGAGLAARGIWRQSRARAPR